MNERIKELRFNAAEYTNEQKPFGITKWNEIRDKKFAELIVKECCDAMQGFTFEQIAVKVLKSQFGMNNEWVIKKVPNTKDEYYVESGAPPDHVLDVYGIAK